MYHIFIHPSINGLLGCFQRRQWHPTPVLLPGKSRGWRSLVASPWGCRGSDTTERPHFHFSLSCIGEGNGNPLQCSCLENPRDGGAWWAAVYRVAQSRTRLKRLSSSSSRLLPCPGYCKQCCCEQLGYLCLFHLRFLRVYAQDWGCRVIWQICSQFFKESTHCTLYKQLSMTRKDGHNTISSA